jgi:hypothetical protein
VNVRSLSVIVGEAEFSKRASMAAPISAPRAGVVDLDQEGHGRMWLPRASVRYLKWKTIISVSVPGIARVRVQERTDHELEGAAALAVGGDEALQEEVIADLPSEAAGQLPAHHAGVGIAQEVAELIRGTDSSGFMAKYSSPSTATFWNALLQSVAPPESCPPCARAGRPRSRS